MKLAIDNKGISIELHGKEQLWALRAKIFVPLENITSIRFAPEFQDWRKWQVRMPGTYAPRLLMAGSYWTELGWDFIYAKRPGRVLNPLVYNVLIIETDQNRYARVIVSCDEFQAKDIIAWWEKNKRRHAKA